MHAWPRRLNLLASKKGNLAKGEKRKVATLLRDDKEHNARILVEQIIREDYTLEAYEMIKQYVELILARFNVLVTRAGVLRSGDVHRHVQYDAIFSGRVAVTSREGGRDVRREYGAGDFIALPAHTPHLFEFLNHTVMAEWWEHVSDRGEPFEARYYTPYRQRISAAMLRGGRRRGPPR